MASENGTKDDFKRAMVVVAHPDDAEYGCSGSVAKWCRLGWDVVYVLCTDGSKGSEDREISAGQLIEIRAREQREAGKTLGLKDVVFLGYPDGYLEPTLELRKDISREIRRWKPDVLITTNPTRDLSSSTYIGHPDHFAAGEAALSAVFPSARDHLTFPELLADEGLETHKVREVWVMTRQDRKARFQTPLFSEYVGEWLDRSLPPADIVEKYKLAGDAWRIGELEQSIAILEPLVSQPWGEVAEKQIEHQNKVFVDFESLAADQAGYQDRLMAFRAELDPVEDVYFVKATNANFETYKEQVLAQLDVLYSDAETQWSEYRNKGKISGLMRVEDHVSKLYKKQAASLSAAYTATTEGLQTYRLLTIDPSAAWSKLADNVADEARRQRDWLGDLNVVLDPVLLKTKLDLLPQLKEQNQ